MSKKLEGNGRWESSRIILPEHREQFNARHDPKVSPMATKEELDLVRSYILLPLILTVAEKNLQQAERLTMTLKPLYVRATEILMDTVTKDLTNIRREMKQRNIKVIEDELRDSVMYYRMYCRGYEDRFGIMREVVRAEMQVRLGKYIDAVLEMANKR